MITSVCSAGMYVLYCLSTGSSILHDLKDGSFDKFHHNINLSIVMVQENQDEVDYLISGIDKDRILTTPKKQESVTIMCSCP